MRFDRAECAALALVAIGIVLAAPAAATPLVVLGDSLSDTGNLYTLTGGALPPRPLANPGAESLYDPGRSPKRFSNGNVWTDYAAARFGLSVNSVWTGNPAAPIQLAGNGHVDNFAVANAFTGPYRLVGAAPADPSYNNWTDLVATQVLGQPFSGLPGLQQQAQLYLQAGVMPDAVHVVWAGANDLFFAPFLDSANVVQTAVGNVTNVLQDLHAAGASRLVVANLPDLGATPFARGETSIPFNPPPGDNRLALSQATQAFNQLLSLELASMPFAVTLIDVEELLALVLQNSAALGFGNVSDPCLDLATLASACSSPDSFLFWDEVHPTTRAHAILGDVFARAIPEPATVAVLLAGLVALFAVERGRIRRIA